MLVGLDQQTALDALHAPFRGGVQGYRGVRPQQPDVLLFLQQLQGVPVVIGGYDAVHEVLRDVRGRRQVHVPVEADDAAEGGHGIDAVGPGERLRDGVRGGHPAGVGMLDDDGRGPLELPDQFQRRLQVQDVVV